MRKSSTVNLNNQVYVTLTQEGEKILRNNYEESILQVRDYIKNARQIVEGQHKVGNKYCFSLWELCSIFGPHLYNGCKIPFEKNLLEIVEG
jgi:hypothetical protein